MEELNPNFIPKKLRETFSVCGENWKILNRKKNTIQWNCANSEKNKIDQKEKVADKFEISKE